MFRLAHRLEQEPVIPGVKKLKSLLVLCSDQVQNFRQIGVLCILFYSEHSAITLLDQGNVYIPLGYLRDSSHIKQNAWRFEIFQRDDTLFVGVQVRTDMPHGNMGIVLALCPLDEGTILRNICCQIDIHIMLDSTPCSDGSAIYHDFFPFGVQFACKFKSKGAI